jgi:hypothetical protein
MDVELPYSSITVQTSHELFFAGDEENGKHEVVNTAGLASPLTLETRDCYLHSI